MEIPAQKGCTDITCAICSSSFLVKNSTIRYRAKRGKTLPMFCSSTCRVLFGGPDDYGRATVVCAGCGATFTTSRSKARATVKQYCTGACSKRHRRTGTVHSCTRCGVSVYVAPNRASRHRTFFCGNACRLAEQYGAGTRTWAGFVESSTEYRRLSDRLRKSAECRAWKKAVLSRAKGVCSTCGCQAALQAHHGYELVNILADNAFDEQAVREDPRFVDPANGAALCEPCHAKVHLLQKSHPAVTSGRKPGELLGSP